jgi:hypothetical protein
MVEVKVASFVFGGPLAHDGGQLGGQEMESREENKCLPIEGSPWM